MTDYNELLRHRRSIRDYGDRDVPLKIVETIIKESCLAPSSGNGQPWKFIIVNNRAVIKRLSDESKRNLLADLEDNPDSPSRNYEPILRDPNFNVFYNAPCLVYILGHKDYRSLLVDCALAASYFMFSSVAKGLGTCWIGLGKNIRDPELMSQIGLPHDHEIVAPVIVGYPRNIPPKPVRMAPGILKVVS